MADIEGRQSLLDAILIAPSVYGLQRIDQTQESISREAAATRQELLGFATAIANSISAARQIQPPMVVVPGPSAPPAPLLPNLRAVSSVSRGQLPGARAELTSLAPLSTTGVCPAIGAPNFACARNNSRLEFRIL